MRRYHNLEEEASPPVRRWRNAAPPTGARRNTAPTRTRRESITTQTEANLGGQVCIYFWLRLVWHQIEDVGVPSRHQLHWHHPRMRRRARLLARAVGTEGTCWSGAAISTSVEPSDAQCNASTALLVAVAARADETTVLKYRGRSLLISHFFATRRFTSERRAKHLSHWNILPG